VLGEGALTTVPEQRRARRREVRLVICDDQPEMREMLRTTLEPDGYSIVGETPLASGALRLCEELRPDVLVLDLMLVGMSGLQAIPLIRAFSPDTKIVVWSGYARHRSAAVSLGVDAVAQQGGPRRASLGAEDGHRALRTVSHTWLRSQWRLMRRSSVSLDRWGRERTAPSSSSMHGDGGPPALR
jgi:CheY-like chemotaxis protein